MDGSAAQNVIAPAVPLKDTPQAEQYPCVSPLDDFDREKTPSPAELHRWRRLAIILCSVSIFLTFLLSLASFVCGSISGSSATFAIAFDAFLAIVSSSVVVWRFCYRGEAKDSLKKERRACGVIAFCFIVSAILICSDSIVTLIYKERPQRPDSTLALAIVNTLVYSLLFLGKYSVAEKLHSAALRADSIDAITGAGTAFSVVISTIICEKVQDAWYIDASVAQVIGILTLAYGVQLLVSVIYNFRNPDEYQRLI